MYPPLLRYIGKSRRFIDLVRHSNLTIQGRTNKTEMQSNLTRCPIAC